MGPMVPPASTSRRQIGWARRHGQAPGAHHSHSHAQPRFSNHPARRSLARLPGDQPEPAVAAEDQGLGHQRGCSGRTVLFRQQRCISGIVHPGMGTVFLIRFESLFAGSGGDRGAPVALPQGQPDPWWPKCRCSSRCLAADDRRPDQVVGWGQSGPGSPEQGSGGPAVDAGGAPAHQHHHRADGLKENGRVPLSRPSPGRRPFPPATQAIAPLPPPGATPLQVQARAGRAAVDGSTTRRCLRFPATRA